MLLLPEDVRRALGEAAISTQVRFAAALGASFGETHVVRAGGAWRLFTRGSFLDPFREVALAQKKAPRVEAQSYRERLVFALADGREESLDVGVLDHDRAVALVRDWLAAPGAPVDERPVSAPVSKRLSPEVAVPAPSYSAPEVRQARQRLVDDLAARDATAPPRRDGAFVRAGRGTPDRALVPRGRAKRTEPDASSFAPRAPTQAEQPEAPLFTSRHYLVVALALAALLFMVFTQLYGQR